MAFRLLRASIGRKKFLEWLAKEAVIGNSYAVLYAQEFNNHWFSEAHVFLDFFENNEVSVIVREWKWRTDNDVKIPRYYSWRGGRQVLEDVLKNETDNYGHTSVMAYVKNHATQTYVYLMDAFKETGFSGADEILKDGKVPSGHGRSKKYNPNNDPRQLRLL
ncbi:hypothetical protein A2619_02645 [candidate division WWE3 bacterium RIFOXYD1_FULL_39_9]|uniref:Uncharacterized protein n=1 Tax=candidate division WWE3 bacterium RIFOXYD1_FULL_39_9 TaxID=1802649 RepID=A0A1F4X971_UNCKA|nr:MAG: hypothetical protein A2619_02645 [candidate division WWE3 bacterium RIFOXYD1_FULL_39_9]